MFSGITRRTLPVAILLLGGLGIAGAQTAASAPPAAGAADSNQEIVLAPQEMLSRGEAYLPQMEQGATGVRRQLEQARLARDVVKMLCLNDKLNQIDVAIRSARDRVETLRIVVSRNDTDRARHEFTVVTVLRDRVLEVVAEASQCIGEEVGFVGDSYVKVEIDPAIPDDPSEFPDEPLISAPPLTSTPIQ
ncbi:MAG: hypothetical protein JW751_22545 [Polyangiaceae bacterium]|nr:hypothetical protein [Polyangiaceae bacterium]